MIQACYVGDHTVLLRTAFGTKMYVDSRDTVVVPHLILDGRWESWVTNFLDMMLGRGDMFVDVGANVGWFTLRAASNVGTGRVVAFEPNPTLAKLLVRSLMINGFDARATVARYALDGKTGAAEPRQRSFNLLPAFAGNGRLAAGNEKGGQTFPVPCTTLDDYFADLDPAIAPFIKIDAEGAEPDIVLGGRKLIERPRTRLLIEHHDSLAEIEVFRELCGDGFQMSLLHHSSELRPLTLEELATVPDSEMIYFARP
jgi:FkbM family methyltransferase